MAEIVAMAGEALLHTPPEIASVSVMVLAVHTVELDGKIAPGALFTVATRVAEHPAIVYEIVAVPTPFPVTTPPPVTDAIAAALLLHTPPAVASVNVTLPPRQMVTGAGVMAAGEALTVIVTKEEQ